VIMRPSGLSTRPNWTPFIATTERPPAPNEALRLALVALGVDRALALALALGRIAEAGVGAGDRLAVGNPGAHPDDMISS